MLRVWDLWELKETEISTICMYARRIWMPILFLLIKCYLVPLSFSFLVFLRIHHSLDRVLPIWFIAVARLSFGHLKTLALRNKLQSQSRSYKSTDCVIKKRQAHKTRACYRHPQPWCEAWIWISFKKLGREGWPKKMQ